MSPGWVVANLYCEVREHLLPVTSWHQTTSPGSLTTSSAHQHLATLLITIHWHHTTLDTHFTIHYHYYTIHKMQVSGDKKNHTLISDSFESPPLKLCYHWKLTRVDAVVMDSWCNGPQVVWAFIVILLFFSIWFIWNNYNCQLPASYTSMASKIGSESGPSPLDYSIYFMLKHERKTAFHFLFSRTK